MGFVEFIVRWTGLSFGFYWSDPHSPLQLPIPNVNSSSHSVIEPLFHDYKVANKFCNTPEDRSCWIKSPLGNFDISTDYDSRWPEGVTREYWLNVTYSEIGPDGYSRIGQVINGTYPGPLIEANWGDRLIIHVTNYLAPELAPNPAEVENNGTTIHWHGIRQYKTTESDGVNGVTQCPAMPYHTYTYEWRATQYGHSWYHSHYSLQYANGLYGPLVIHGPTSENWDEDAGVLLISDWVHLNAFEVFSLGELSNIISRNASSTVMNGHGIYPCFATDLDPISNCTNDNGTRHEIVVKANKKYILRIVNTSADMHFRFAIDNHMLDVVQADFVPIEPYRTESINIGIGQRYTVIITTTPNSTDPFPSAPEGNNFWIRTIPLSGCGNLELDKWPTYGIFRYEDSGLRIPGPDSKPYNMTYYNSSSLPDCLDVSASDLHPVVPWSIPDPLDEQNFTIDMTDDRLVHGFHRWRVGGEPMWLDWGDPTILNLANTSWNPEYAVVLPNTDPDTSIPGWVYFYIQGNFTDPSPLRVAHPLHLHGHDFAILAQGTGVWERPSSGLLGLLLDNPLRRDVALLDATGYLVIAFRKDNPGVWLMHCHIAWHASSGLALQLMERQGEVDATIRNPGQLEDTCKAWREFWKGAGILQDDSGV